MKPKNSSSLCPSGKRSLTTNPAAVGGEVSIASFTPPGDESLMHTPAPAGTFRVLLGLDLPVAMLADIEADWVLVNSGAENAEAAAEQLDAALQRLFEHAVNVSGVAIAEPLPNPLVRYQRHAA